MEENGMNEIFNRLSKNKEDWNFVEHYRTTIRLVFKQFIIKIL